MRLLNTATLTFEEFIGYKIPEYAILSHTWGDEEVSYKDMSCQNRFGKKGYRKIKMACQIAAQSGIQYAWVDTCNIDKSSSAELTEAINSMFQWYRRARVCYVILEDLPASAPIESLKDCRWFTRGWTLQELLAPYHILFFDQDWNCRGSKVDLARQLAKITKISTEILLHKRPLSTVAVAQRMSWASQRQTTRLEDMAYSLLGIFGVNMPLLYGEEWKAFRRLQEEIIKSTPDFSIFAWKLAPSHQAPNPEPGRKVCGLLAPYPAAFASCGSITIEPGHELTEFTTTNLGIRTRADVLTINISGERNQAWRYIFPLRSSSADGSLLSVQLRQCGPDQFVRENPWNLTPCPLRFRPNGQRERYLFTQLPQSEMEPFSIMDMGPFLSHTRPHVLQVVYGDGLGVSGEGNWSRYDDEDDVFFVSENIAHDWSAIRFEIRVPGITWHPYCSFYAFRWSCLDRHDKNPFQYTLVDDQRFRNSLNGVSSSLVTLNPTTFRVLNALKSYNIPRTSSVAIKCPTNQKTIFVSCVASIEEYTNICPNRFWRVRFSTLLLDDRDVPDIPVERWVY